MITPTPLESALKQLLNGGVGVMPTDTVYGLVARADDAQATTRLYALKHREQKPGTIIAANTEQISSLGVPAAHLQKVQHLWPNPLSVILTVDDNRQYLHQTLGALPFRIPKDEKIRALLEQTGPLVTSSANQPGEPTAVNIIEACNYFGDDVDFYVDGGDLGDHAPSTIVRIAADGSLEVLRQGAVEI